MHPELFTLPILGISIKTYGFCMMVGFLSAVWLGMKRAERVKADPDVLLDMSLLCLLFGVGGARLFYVAHYWSSQFADVPNKLFAIVDITKGGLEFLGGFLGAAVAIAIYSARKKISLRLYMDLLAPITMWGLAFGRLGCFFNGCCFGGACALPASASESGLEQQPQYAWAVEFPFASPAFWRQWEERELTVPAELIVALEESLRLQPWLVSGSVLSASEKKRKQVNRNFLDARRPYDRARADGASDEELAGLKVTMEAAEKRKKTRDLELLELLLAQRFPSRVAPQRHSSVTELQELAGSLWSRPVHPAQLYSAVHALLLSLVLTALFYIRKRHGVVVAALLILYPIPRILLEMIRADNPHDVGGLTISQSVSVGMLITGIAVLYLLYKHRPERSPLRAAEASETPRPA